MGLAGLLAVLRLRWARVALIVASLTGLLLCLSPVLGVPGIESALVLGLVLPPFAAALAVRVVRLRMRDEWTEPSMANTVGDATALAALLFALPSALLLANTLRVPACGLREGLAFLALGPGFAVLLAAAYGVVVGLVVPRPKLATTLAFLTPIALDLVELWDFYDTPAIYAYGHMVGYFPGTLYDADIVVTPTYLSFRVLTATWILSFHGLAFLVLHRAELLERWHRVVSTAALGALAVLGAAYGTDLGHQSTAESITEELGGRLVSGRCVVVFPRELPRRDARRLADDCDYRVARVEQVLGVTQPVRVTAFFFRSAEEKRALMGASHTYVAKPWRDEVYLQISDWPHPVLFHEVVHVVAGNIGRGPFRIAGTMGGLLPSPAIIEGTAVAVAWEGRGGLTPHQWARAMLEVDLAPPLRSVDGLSFLLQPASRAYTTSGSFLRWVMETQGTDALRRIYLTGDLEEALGRPLDELEAEWHAFLMEEVELPPEARALAEQRFEQPGLFGRICPHRIANLRGELRADLSAGDDHAALERCEAILELDPGQASTRATMVSSLARVGRREDAEAQLAALRGPPSAATPIVQRARRELADALWKRGQADDARAIYEALAEEPMDEDSARQIEVRLAALDRGGAAERALLSLLVPRLDATQDSATSMHQITHLARVSDDGLASYLEARQLMFRQRYDLAWPRVREARRLGLPTARTDREARRMEGVIAFGVGEMDAATAIFEEILADPSSSDGQRVEAEDWLARLALR